MGRLSRIVSRVTSRLIEYSPHPKSRVYMGFSIWTNAGALGLCLEDSYEIGIALLICGGYGIFRSIQERIKEEIKKEIDKLKKNIDLEKKVEELSNEELVKEWATIMTLYDIKDMGYKL